MFRVTVSGPREREARSSPWSRGATQAEHAAQSLAKGSRMVVVGRLQQRSWTAEDGSARSVVEVVADELGASLRSAAATIRPRRARTASQLDQRCDGAGRG
jgi:single-strand DNA-binding protein